MPLLVQRFAWVGFGLGLTGLGLKIVANTQAEKNKYVLDDIQEAIQEDEAAREDLESLLKVPNREGSEEAKNLVIYGLQCLIGLKSLNESTAEILSKMSADHSSSLYEVARNVPNLAIGALAAANAGASSGISQVAVDDATQMNLATVVKITGAVTVGLVLWDVVDIVRDSAKKSPGNALREIAQDLEKQLNDQESQRPH